MKYSNFNKLLPVNDTNLVYLYESYKRQGKYEFSSVQEDDRKQKGLIYIVNNTYLYIDCQSIIYIKISDATEVIRREIHNIPLKITKVQYLKDTSTRKHRINTSLGTLAVKYSMNGYEENIMLCDVNLSEPPDCYSPTTKTVGSIVDLFIYKSQLRQNKCYLIIGSISKSSMFSIISIFEDYRKEDQGYEKDLLMFKFYGKITATVLGIQKFLLDAMAIFDRYMIFSNEDSLFVTNLEKFIESPQYFSPTQMKKIELNPLISLYSGKVFTNTECIAKILVLDRCLSYVSVFVHTKYYGTLMLEVPKAAFNYDDWDFDTVPLTFSNLNESNKINFKESKSVIQTGRILQNIYSYDYSRAEFVMNEKVMGILLKNHIDKIFSYYVLRIINLLTHEQSMVYRDIYIFDANECIGLNLEEQNSYECTMMFSISCDSAIFKYSVSLKEEFVINPKHTFWNDPRNRLYANVSQAPIFGISSSSILIELNVYNDSIGEVSDSAFYGILLIIGILTVSIFILKCCCVEIQQVEDESSCDDSVLKKTIVLKTNYELKRQTSRKSLQKKIEAMNFANFPSQEVKSTFKIDIKEST